MTLFLSKGDVYNIPKDKGETDEQHIIRGNFIAKHNPISDEQLNNLLLISRLYIKIKYTGCKYSDDIHKLVDTYNF